MEITTEALEEFKEIYRKEFKENISDEEALEMAQRVLRLFMLINKYSSSEQKDLSRMEDEL